MRFKEFRDKKWTNFERKSAFAAVMESDDKKILPIRFDDSEILGLRSTVKYQDARKIRPAEMASLVVGVKNARPYLRRFQLYPRRFLEFLPLITFRCGG